MTNVTGSRALSFQLTFKILKYWGVMHSCCWELCGLLASSVVWRAKDDSRQERLFVEWVGKLICSNHKVVWVRIKIETLSQKFLHSLSILNSICENVDMSPFRALKFTFDFFSFLCLNIFTCQNPQISENGSFKKELPSQWKTLVWFSSGVRIYKHAVCLPPVTLSYNSHWRYSQISQRIKFPQVLWKLKVG